MTLFCRKKICLVCVCFLLEEFWPRKMLLPLQQLTHFIQSITSWFFGYTNLCKNTKKCINNGAYRASISFFFWEKNLILWLAITDLPCKISQCDFMFFQSPRFHVKSINLGDFTSAKFAILSHLGAMNFWFY